MVRMGAAQELSCFTWVSPDYFRAMAIPLIAGRSFNLRDTVSSPHVAVVNQMFVRKFSGGVNPVGKTLVALTEPMYPSTVSKLSASFPTPDTPTCATLLRQ